MGRLHDPAKVQQTTSKYIQNTRANAGRLLDRVNTLLRNGGETFNYTIYASLSKIKFQLRKSETVYLPSRVSLTGRADANVNAIKMSESFLLSQCRDPQLAVVATTSTSSKSTRGLI